MLSVMAISAAGIGVLYLLRKGGDRSTSPRRRALTGTERVPDYDLVPPVDVVPRNEWIIEWQNTLRRFLGREFSEAEERAYRAVFGDNSQSAWKLAVYSQVVAAGTNCLYAPKGSYYRPLFDHFVAMGLMTTGYDIPPKSCLTGLSVADLKQMAEQLGAGRAHTMSTLRALLSRFPDEQLILGLDSLTLKMSDLFLADLSVLETMAREHEQEPPDAEGEEEALPALPPA